MKGAVLSRNEILNLLSVTPPLIEGIINTEQQIQPNGVDLTIRDVALIASTGTLAADNKNRVLSAVSPLAFDPLGFMELLPDCYLITYNEIVHLPKNVMALGLPRSSLLRCGVDVHTAVWDAGYSGRSQSLMVVYNSQGFRIQKNARVLQLVFFHLSSEATEGYSGVFQGENI